MLIDYSLLRPSMAELKAAGVTAAGRYLGWDCEPGFGCIGKNLSAAEAHELLGAGIDIWLAFEYAADAALSGAVQGARDAALAARQLHDLGAPDGMAVYFALDFDLQDFAPQLKDDGSVPVARAKLGPVAHYFDAINASKPGYQVGGYGGYWAVKRLLDAKLVSLGWQTIAWSGGQWDKRAVLHQLASQVFGAADVNLHAASTPDFGQWPRPHVSPPGFPAGRHAADGSGTLAALAVRQGCDVAGILWTTAAELAAEDNMTGPGTLQRRYLNAGRWDAKMPHGMILWLP